MPKAHFVFPVKPVLDLIGERESMIKELVPGFHRDDVWTPAFALRGVVPYPPACKPYGLEAGTESGVTTLYEFIIHKDYQFFIKT